MAIQGRVEIEMYADGSTRGMIWQPHISAEPLDYETEQLLGEQARTMLTHALAVRRYEHDSIERVKRFSKRLREGGAEA